MADHAHIAIRLLRTITVADLVEHINYRSSYWIKQQNGGSSLFTWQRGYVEYDERHMWE